MRERVRDWDKRNYRRNRVLHSLLLSFIKVHQIGCQIEDVVGPFHLFCNNKIIDIPSEIYNNYLKKKK